MRSEASKEYARQWYQRNRERRRQAMHDWYMRTLGATRKRFGTPEERFWAKVDRAGDDECWNWKGYTQRGYGIFWVKPRRIPAHRFSYEALVGPIPDGLVLDHLCRNTRCVNPRHLEPVTNAVNVLRGVSPMAQFARLTVCPRCGSEYSNQKIGRRCKPCQRERARARYQADPEKARQTRYSYR